MVVDSALDGTICHAVPYCVAKLGEPKASEINQTPIKNMNVSLSKL